MAVQVSRREIAVPGVQREITVLPRLAAVLPLPIPDPHFVGNRLRATPGHSSGPGCCQGANLPIPGLADSARAGAAAAVGHFLRMLHDPVLVGLVNSADLPVDPMRRASAPVRARRAREDLARLVERRIWSPDNDVSRLLDQADRAYGRPISAERELAARACAISLAASLAEYAAADGRAALLRESLAGLSRVVAA